MKRFLSLALAMVLFLALLAGCKSNGTEQTSGGTGGTSEGIHVVYIGSRLGDNSVSDAIFEGFKQAEADFGIKTTMIESPTDPSKFKAAVAEACDTDAQLIFGNAGSGMIDELILAARDYPEKYFMCLDAPVDHEEIPELPNFVGVMCKQNECSYLVGYLAALMSKTGKIGGIVGVEYPVLSDFLTGYISGAKEADPNIQVATAAIGDFVDQAKAKEIALAQYRQGADVVFAIAGTASYGILEASKETGNWGIGVDVDMAANFIGKDDEQANAILTSAIKDWGFCAYHVIDRFVNDRDAIGWASVEVYGIANGGCTYVKNDIYEKAVSDEIKAEMDKLVERVTSGELKVPSFFEMTAEEYEALKESVKMT